MSCVKTDFLSDSAPHLSQSEKIGGASSSSSSLPPPSPCCSLGLTDPLHTAYRRRERQYLQRSTRTMGQRCCIAVTVSYMGAESEFSNEVVSPHFSLDRPPPGHTRGPPLQAAACSRRGCHGRTNRSTSPSGVSTDVKPRSRLVGAG
jgi:hypothetical protein